MSKIEAIIAHPARRLIIASFAVSLPINIVAGAIIQDPLPAVGLVPLGVAAFLAALFLRVVRANEFDAPQKKRGISTVAVALASDALAVAGLLIVLCLTWNRCLLSNRYGRVGRWYPGWDSRRHTRRIFLVGYATAPMLVNLFAHFYLILLGLYHGLEVQKRIDRHIGKQPNTCPHCHEDLEPSYAPYFSFARDGYQPIAIRDGENYRDEEQPTTGLIDPANDLPDAQDSSKGKVVEAGQA